MSLRNYDRPADRIKLHLQAASSVPVLVEGPSDELVLRPHLSDVTFFPLNGRNNVVAVLRELVLLEATTILGIIDLDFDDQNDFADLAAVVHFYSGADLESMLVELGALAQLLLHVGSQAKIDALGGPDVLVDSLKDCVAPISRLRLISRRDHLGLSFDSVNLQDKIDRRTLVLRVGSYCSALAAASMGGPSATELQSLATAASECRHSGKDIASAAGVALRYRAGSRPSAATTPDLLISELRASSGLALSQSAWLAEVLSRLRDMRSSLLAQQKGWVG